MTHLRSPRALPLALALFLPALLPACGSSHTPGGSDSGVTRDSGPIERDAGPPIDAGPPSSCDAEDARAELCPEILCDGLPSWHWDGERCFAIDCGACVGADCEGDPPRSEEACVAAHAGCEPALCRATGGEWMWWAEECGHYQCGFAPPIDCLVGMPVCNCGYGAGFDPSSGCVPVAECPEVDPLPREELCLSTGGRWEAICCDAECGVPCGDACTDMACNCGPEKVLDPVHGCVVASRCLERSAGEPCDGLARCEGSTICCDTCGGAGCSGMPTCRYPVCDEDPDIDTCGNNRLAP